MGSTKNQDHARNHNLFASGIIQHTNIKLKIGPVAHFSVFLKRHKAVIKTYASFNDTNTDNVKHFRTMASFRGIDDIR